MNRGTETPLRVLVACEYSGRVRDAFIRAGHDALSCDLLPTEVAGPHHQGDVTELLGDGWDLMVALWIGISALCWAVLRFMGGA
ncbi:MAG: hypothetical protein V7660_10505 [Hyphomonas sp.]